MSWPTMRMLSARLAELDAQRRARGLTPEQWAERDRIDRARTARLSRLDAGPRRRAA